MAFWKKSKNKQPPAPPCAECKRPVEVVINQVEQPSPESPRPRPCMVKGCRAMFHRWADSGRPVVPRGVPVDETATRFQSWHVHAIVEYADGTIERVWPYEVQFIDGGGFENVDWPEIISQDEQPESEELT